MGNPDTSSVQKYKEDKAKKLRIKSHEGNYITVSSFFFVLFYLLKNSYKEA